MEGDLRTTLQVQSPAQARLINDRDDPVGSVGPNPAPDINKVYISSLSSRWTVCLLIGVPRNRSQRDQGGAVEFLGPYMVDVKR